jgi:Family of unknown function (DUF6113)
LTSALRHVAALLVGVVVGVASVAVHRSAFPLGLVLAAATTYAVPWWLLRSPAPRTATSYAVGWLVVLGVAVAGRPEGDFVVAQDVEGIAFLVVGLGLVAVALAGITGGRGSGT